MTNIISLQVGWNLKTLLKNRNRENQKGSNVYG